MSRSTATALSLCVILIAIPSLISASMLWSGIYQINPAYDEWFRDAVPVLGGDWVVVGTMGMSSPNVPPEIRVTRIDRTGEVLWDKHVAGAPQHPGGNIARGVAASPDGGCVTVAEIVVEGGIGAVDALVTKWSPGGAVEWHRLIGTTGEEYRWFVTSAVGVHGGYFAFGVTSVRPDSSVSGSLHVVKFAENGTLLWQKEIGAGGFFSISGYSPLTATADGGCVVLGYGSSNQIVVKLAENGDEVWKREIGREAGGTPDSYYLSSVSQDPRGGYILAGRVHVAVSVSNRLWLLRLDDSGFIDWFTTVYGAGPSWGHDAVGIDDGYLAVAVTDGNGWFVRTDLNGDVVWQRSYDFPTGAVIASDIVLGPGDTFVGIGRDYRSKAGWFLRAPVSSGIVGAGCVVGDPNGANASEQNEVKSLAEFPSTIPVSDGLMVVDSNPTVSVFDLSATRLVDCSEINPNVMADDFESGDFGGWSDFFE